MVSGSGNVAWHDVVGRVKDSRLESPLKRKACPHRCPPLGAPKPAPLMRLLGPARLIAAVRAASPALEQLTVRVSSSFQKCAGNSQISGITKVRSLLTDFWK